MAVMGQKKQVSVPHEPGEWIEIQELTGLQLEEARAGASTSVIKRLGAVDPETMKNFRLGRIEVADEPDEPEPKEDLLRAYDQAMILKAGISAWSYTDFDCTEGNRIKLDEITKNWIIPEIVNYSRRTLPE